MGIQVVERALLRILGREPNGLEHNRRAIENIRSAGFERVNVDLMYGLLGQSEASWAATVAHAISLAPEYVTLYRMRYKQTRLWDDAQHVPLASVQNLARIAKVVLAEAGYHANPGKTTFSRVSGDAGTSRYLERRVVEGLPYLGLGLGAQSFTCTTISYNAGAADKRLGSYLSATGGGRLPIQDLYDLPMRHVMAKMACVAFYFGEIDRPSFAAKFGVSLDEAFAEEIALLEERGWMTDSVRALSLTEEGAPWVNGIIPLFCAPSVQAVLLDHGLECASAPEQDQRLAFQASGMG
jgi:oxygen-independent coproporphyrinogen-3 oxidase